MSALITAEGLVRLDAALAWIDEHPEQHDQDMWIKREPGCGTTACPAGTMAQLAGGVPVWDADAGAACEVRLPDGVVRMVDVFACELLGVPYEGEVASDLFFGANDAQDLHVIRDRLAESLEPARWVETVHLPVLGDSP